jgi:hypothetical protein
VVVIKVDAGKQINAYNYIGILKKKKAKIENMKKQRNRPVITLTIFLKLNVCFSTKET